MKTDSNFSDVRSKNSYVYFENKMGAGHIKEQIIFVITWRLIKIPDTDETNNNESTLKKKEKMFSGVSKALLKYIR